MQPRSSKGSAFLFLLAATPDGLPRRELTELLWDAGKARNLRQALFQLRRLPGAESWLQGGNAQNLCVNAQSDLSAFERAVQAERYEEALTFWRRPFLAVLEPPPTATG